MGTPVMGLLTLRFADAALEERYRLVTDARCLRLWRIACVMALAIFEAACGVLALLRPTSTEGLDFRLMAAYGAFVLFSGIALSWLPVVTRAPQRGVAALCVMFPVSLAIGYLGAPADFVAHRAFAFMVLHMFTVNSLLRLRLVPAFHATWLSIAAYVALVQAWNLVDAAALAWHLFWTGAAAGWGLWMCYQIDLASRREFLAQAAADRERERSERLLLNILPAPIAQRLKDSVQSIAERREAVTVLFADLVGFTALASQREPDQVVAMLDAVFTEFDRLAAAHGLEKIKTIGDAYMAVGGLPLAQADHAERAARMALAVVDVVRRAALETGEPLQVRVGLHSGGVVAGVIGRSKFSYDLWGDTVNIASRMQSSGLPQAVHCSADTAGLLQGRFALVARGPQEIKGKGAMETFLVTAAH